MKATGHIKIMPLSLLLGLAYFLTVVLSQLRAGNSTCPPPLPGLADFSSHPLVPCGALIIQEKGSRHDLDVALCSSKEEKETQRHCW